MPTKTLIAGLLLLLVGYGVIEARHLLGGPSIELAIPSNYTTFPEGLITITGKANNTENLSLNGGPLPIDEEGHFEKTVIFAAGGGILSLTATDRFGRMVTERRTIFVPLETVDTAPNLSI